MPADRSSAPPAARPLVPDALLACGVALAAALADRYGPDYRSTLAPYWDVALAAPLALRRTAPATAAALVAGVCFATWLTDVVAIAAVGAVLIMLYSLGAWERRRWLLAAALVVGESGVIMAVARWTPQGRQWLTALMATGTVTAALVIGLYVRTRRAYLASMIERAETAERDRDHQARIAVAEERTRMAREMHDVIAHSLAVMITLNDAAAATSPEGPVRETVVQASEAGRQALAEMQRILGVLRGAGPADAAPQPGVAQLADLISIARSAGLRVELAVSGEPGDLAPTAQLTIYRIVQESLTNVLKHGRNVRRVVVTLDHREDRVRIRVGNDGEPGAPANAGTVGHGLVGMRERTALYQGEFHAGPTRGGGWEVVADLAVTDPAGAA
ncbi:histidine kinase [Streptomyces sp. V4-01]|uniref:histidine kinase n=1 Tax=Actinacidiphila polyblastidii TaxID=3110430 RepID=A0ABU7PBF1_9ACTN|nr:histidine kinase [Streptomyces sp. V4-01]